MEPSASSDPTTMHHAQYDGVCHQKECHDLICKVRYPWTAAVPDPTRKCHFWRLPREIRDMVYDYAYSSSDRENKVIIKPVWEQEHEALRQCETKSTQVWTPALTQYLMVSREWLAEATAPFYAGRNLHFDRVADLKYFLTRNWTARQHVTEIAIPCPMRNEARLFEFIFRRIWNNDYDILWPRIAAALNACPRLKAVRVLIDRRDWAHYSFFETKGRVYGDGFNPLQGLDEVMKLRGLKELTLRSAPDSAHRHIAPSSTMMTVEAFLTNEVTKPRATG